jgi:uncharacterized protein
MASSTPKSGLEFTIPGPVGRLEALYHEAEGTDRPRALCVVCHPHPLHGGTMHSTVAFRIARGLQMAGIASLRINFRGVGASQGTHDGEGGEEGDALAALEWLAERHPDVPWWGAGFSFGSRTVFGLAKRERRIERLVLVGFPLGIYDLPDADRLAQPTLFVWGERDQYGTLSDFQSRYPSTPPHLELREIPQADHFFKRHTKELEGIVREWA